MDGGTTESAGRGRSTVVESLGSLEGWWNASGIALWSFVLFGAFLLNATLLLAFLKRPGLRTISNRFVMNLTVSNLLTCAILNPLLMLDGPSSSTSSSPSTHCLIAESATALATTSSIFSVLLIAIDQYLAVVDPLRYRTRIDKFKCGILMISVWLVSLVFALLAGFNPNPQSLWLVCKTQIMSSTAQTKNYTQNSTLDMMIDTSLRLILNASKNYGPEDEFTFTEFDEDFRFIENSTDIVEETFIEEDIDQISTSINGTELITENFEMTYGFVYAMAYALFAYLMPFVGVCWIYVSIYSAAHKNSERTRRTGSRPILSTGSFSEEYYPVRQDVSTEDFRRIPKISSLSSIDESIETLTPSQMIPRRGSEFVNNSNNYHQTTSTIEEEEPSAIIFTVGSQKVDVTPQSREPTQLDYENTKDSNINNKVPISVLKAQFLGNTESNRAADDLVKSKFREEPTQKRKSSHDLMYEEMLRKDLEKLRIGQDSSDEDSSDEEENENEEFEKDSTSETPDAEAGRLRDAIIQRIHYQSSIVNDDHEDRTDGDEILGDQNDRRSSESSKGDTNQDSNLFTTIDCISSRKSSLENTTNNIAAQSSILKCQHGCLSNGKTHHPTSVILHKFEGHQPIELKESPCGSSQMANSVTHICVPIEKTRYHLRENNGASGKDINQDSRALTIIDDVAIQKNSLEDTSNNPASQSSILKCQHGCLPIVKMHNHNSQIFHKFETHQGTQLEEELCARSSTGHYDAHGSVYGTPSNTPIVTITPPNKPSLHRVSSIRSTSSYINSLKHRISNGSLFKYREETRAARISALVIVMGLICWTPYVVVLVLNNISFLMINHVSHGTNVAALSFLILAAYVSPLLFGYRSRRVKRELRKFFCFRKELSYKNNRSLMAKKVMKRRHSGTLSQLEMDARYNIFNCVYGRTRWPKEKVQFVQVPETALVVETCRSSFSSGASTQISSTSTEEC